MRSVKISDMMLPKPFAASLDQVTLFFIPIVSLEKTNAASQRKLRHDCTPIEYKRRREARQSRPFLNSTIKPIFATGFL